jgi:hypothetical protein
MGTPTEPKPVKLFAALLANSAELFHSTERDLASLLGSIDSSSQTLPWEVTNYYSEEMGAGLLRRFVSFSPLMAPEALPEIKLATQGLEEKYRRIEVDRRGRRVNIDPGYLDVGKAVLASTKGASHRIYLRSGIYAETTLLFRDGSLQPYEHTYPDYLWPEARSFFAALRALYLSQLRQLASGSRETQGRSP